MVYMSRATLVIEHKRGRYTQHAPLAGNFWLGGGIYLHHL